MSHAADDVTSGTTTDEAGDAETDRPRTPRRTIVAIVAGVAVVAAASVAAGVAVRADREPEAAPVPASVPVALTASGLPDDTRLGLVLTLGQGEGSEWNGAAQGARVAERRFELGGADVSLVTVDDGGTVDGARAAVESLVDQGVAGIVVASAGQHVSGALDAASDAGVPVVLPYGASDEADGVSGAWSTAPSQATTGAALATALGDARRTLVVDLGGGSPIGVEVARVLAASTIGDDTAVADEVARLTGSAAPLDDPDATTAAPEPVTDPSDAVVLSGSAARQAGLVSALQATDLRVPVLLTPDATSPAFSTALSAGGGSLSSGFLTVGVDSDDAVALRSDAAGRSMSAYLGAVRVLASDDAATNLTDDQPFSAVAAQADSRSHDAVVALVRAVATADSVDPAEVSTALSSLSLGAAEGVAGPALDFTAGTAAGGGELEVLHASSQPLGLRPTADGESRIVWFADPATN